MASDDVPLLTPSQIDELTLQRNLAPCDFSHVIDADFETDWRVVHGTCMDNFQFPALGALGTLDVGSRVSMADGILLCAGQTITNAALLQMRLMTNYLREFLSKPNPLLGRAGPTCPYMPRALKLDTVRIGVAPSGTAATAAEMVLFVRGFIPIYEELAPQAGPTATFKALLLLFPHIPIASAPELIDGTQAALKEQFVSRGLMLGEFHLLNNTPALHNSRFFPLRTVCPALAIRQMVPSDLVFLSADKYPVQRRVAFLQSYVDKMSGQKGAKAQADVMSAQTQLDALFPSEVKSNVSGS